MPEPMSNLIDRRTAVVVAHPGHEIRLFHWLELLHPTVHVLTDGSGRTGRARIASTRRVLESCGARAGAVFSAAPDRAVYDACRRRDVDFFRPLVARLAAALVRDRIECVIGDAAEGQIMAHDLWRGIRIAAMEHAERELGYPLVHYEFPVDGHPSTCPPGLAPYCLRLELHRTTFERKLAAAHAYPEIAVFVAASLEAFGANAFRRETIFPFTPSSLLPAEQDADQLEYERHGEALVAAGHYAEVIRYESHIAPILDGIATFQDAA